MIPELRARFNSSWTPAAYERFLSLVAGRTGGPSPFRLSESPVFLPCEVVERAARYGREIVEQLLSDEGYLQASETMVPPRWRVPDEDTHPLYVQADFGLVRDEEGQWQPKLVEIQGFPSLYALQPVVAACYRDAYGVNASLPIFPGGLTPAAYHAKLRRAIMGDCDPENVVLLELDPANQKTRADFRVTEQLFGLRAVDIREVFARGRRLYYSRQGLEIPIHRIYNRAIVDELERRQAKLRFDFTADYDVQWSGHPNWFFRLSKFSLPYLSHPAVPRTRFLNAVARVTDLESAVLKPLFSFAGLGVVIGPTREQIDAIPEDERRDYILQSRVNFTPAIETPHGAAKIEIRVMYLWLEELEPVNLIIRSGRGAQMGVDHNKDMQWVGASAAFIVPGNEHEL
jgi:hypothetical protein